MYKAEQLSSPEKKSSENLMFHQSRTDVNSVALMFAVVELPPSVSLLVPHIISVTIEQCAACIQEMSIGSKLNQAVATNAINFTGELVNVPSILPK